MAVTRFRPCGGVLDRDRDELAAPGLGQAGRAAAAREQLQYRGVGGLRPQYPLQGGVDVGEQAADAVGRPAGLAGQIVVEADQHTQLGQGLVAGVTRRSVCGSVRAASAMT